TLARARVELQAGAFEAALATIAEVQALDPASEDAAKLQAQVLDARDERQADFERQRLQQEAERRHVEEAERPVPAHTEHQPRAPKRLACKRPCTGRRRRSRSTKSSGTCPWRTCLFTQRSCPSRRSCPTSNRSRPQRSCRRSNGIGGRC